MFKSKVKQPVWTPVEDNKPTEKNEATEIDLQEECQQDRQASVNGGQLIKNINNDISTPRSRANMKVLLNPSSVCEIKSKHSFITDRYNPKPLSSSPMSFTRSVLNEMTSPRKTPRGGILERTETIKDDKQENKIKADHKQSFSIETKSLPPSPQRKTISGTRSLNEDFNKHSNVINKDKNESMSLKGSLDLQQYFLENKKDRDQITKEFKEFLETSLSGTNFPAEKEILRKDKETPEIHLNDQQIEEKIIPTSRSVDQKNTNKCSTIIASSCENLNDKLNPDQQKASTTGPNLSPQTTHRTNLTSSAPSAKVKTKSSILLISPPKSKFKLIKNRPASSSAIKSAKKINSATSIKSSAASSRTQINTNSEKEIVPNEKSKPWYDVEKARQFMLEQQKRRKAQAKSTNKTKIENEDIKKRLAELRKSSQQIVVKNVKKVQKKLSKGTIGSQETMEIGRPEGIKKAESVAVTVENVPVESTTGTNPTVMNKKTKQSAKLPDRGLIVFQKTDSARNTNLLSVPSAVFQKNKERVANAPATEEAIKNEKSSNISACSLGATTEKRVGILRRSESFALADALSLDISTILNQKLILATESEKPPPTTKTKQYENISSEIHETSDHHLTADFDKDFQLKIPDSMASLKSSTLRSDVLSTKSKGAFTNKSSTKHTSKRQIPYWLKPTPVQVYPYTFIRAVRKKLESIANTNEETTSINGRSLETPVARPKFFRKTNTQNFRKNLDQNPEQSRSQQMIETINSVPLLRSISSQSNKQEEAQQDKLNSKDPSSVSELNTNFSSISLHISGSNTTSDFSSFQSDARRITQNEHLLGLKMSENKSTNNENGSDTESVSSAIFSHSSPEKKSINFKMPPQPLSTENIEKLQISSKSLPSISTNRDCQFVTVQRGDEIEFKKANSTDITDSNIRDLLESFNRSLSQVIQVNQKLHNALANPPKSILNPIDWNTKFGLNLYPSANVNNQIENIDYSESFENSTVKDEKHLYSSSFESANNSQTDRRKSASESSANSETKNNSIKEIVEEMSENETIKSLPESNANKLEIENESAADLSLEKNQIESFPSTDVNKTIDNVDHTKNSSTTIPSEISIQTTNSKDQITESIVETLNSNQKTDEIKTNNETITNGSQTEIETTLNIENHSIVPSTLATPFNNNCNFKRNTDIPSSSDELTAQIKDKDLNSTYGSDIYAIINQTEMEFSVLSTNDNQTIISEGSLSYSSIGMYEQLINSEARKEEHLRSMIKIRERALIDRTKGQIAWLELQKQKFKQLGMTAEIASTKKKQRALIVRLEKERAAMNKLKELDESQASSSATAKSSHKIKFTHNHNTNLKLRRRYRGSGDKENSPQMVAVRGIDISGTGSGLEEILQTREEKLRKRRHHVEHLMKWHQRLDTEEHEVLEMERFIMTHNSAAYQSPLAAIRESSDQSKSSSGHSTIQKYTKIKEIESSLTMLQSISPTTVDGIEVPEYVEASGHRMNKLWRRLTGQTELKFNPNERYKLSKCDLEKLYEDAKIMVLMKFNSGSQILGFLNQSNLEQSEIDEEPNKIDGKSKNTTYVLSDQDSLKSMSNIDLEAEEERTIPTASELTDKVNTESVEEATEIPVLDLNFSPDRSEEDASQTSERLPESNEDGFYFSQNESSPKLVDRSSEVEEIIEAKELNTQSIAEEDSKIDTISMEESISQEYSSVESDSLEQSKSFLYRETNDINSLKEEITDLPSKTFVDNQIPANHSDESIQQLPDNSEVMIDDISFPQFDLTVNNDVTQPNLSVVIAQEFSNDIDDKYLSDEFEQSAADKTVNSLSDSESKNTFDESNSQQQPQHSVNDDSYTVETKTESLNESREERDEHDRTDSPEVKSKELEKRLIDIDVSLKDISETIDRSPVMEIRAKSPEKLSPTSSKQDLPPLQHHHQDQNKINKEPVQALVRNKNINEAFPLTDFASKSDKSVGSSAALKRDYAGNATEYKIAANKMPDIISEAEVLRRQQLQIEQEIKQLEQTVPMVYLREIPNKPPPPYVPPAHGSPMTTIFPSNNRIRDIIFRRMKELYDEHCKEINPNPDFSPTSPSILDENITNIYERIILDICRECFVELQAHLPQSEETATEKLFRRNRYKYPMAFFNPPDRLVCIQEYVVKRAMHLLNVNDPVTVIGFGRNYRSSSICGRRKRDLVDEILIQEIAEEDAKWINFDAEEEEVIHSFASEILDNLIDEIIEETILNAQETSL